MIAIKKGDLVDAAQRLVPQRQKVWHENQYGEPGINISDCVHQLCLILDGPVDMPERERKCDCCGSVLATRSGQLRESQRQWLTEKWGVSIEQHWCGRDNSFYIRTESAVSERRILSRLGVDGIAGKVVKEMPFYEVQSY